MVHATPWQPQYVPVNHHPGDDDAAAYKSPAYTCSVVIFPPAQQYIDGHELETAYWHNQTLAGRRIAPLDVLKGYKADSTSLRSGFFCKSFACKKEHWQINPSCPTR